jgi:hypothetical protein
MGNDNYELVQVQAECYRLSKAYREIEGFIQTLMRTAGVDSPEALMEKVRVQETVSND